MGGSGGSGGSTATGGAGGSGGGTGGSGGNPSGGAGGSGGGATGGSGGTPPVYTYSLLDDLEDENNQILIAGGGYWYTADDAGAAACITPRGDEVLPESLAMPVRTDSYYVMHFTISSCAGWGAEAGFGLQVAGTDVLGPYDASTTDGISFWARAATAPTHVNVQIADAATHPDGGMCDDTSNATTTTQCYAHYYKRVTLTADWQRFDVRFDELLKPTYGFHADEGLLTDQLFQVSFKWAADKDYEIWIDDVSSITEQ